MSQPPLDPTPASGDRTAPRFHLRFEAGEVRLELARPLQVGPATVDRLALSLGRLDGPVDLGAGARRFRHRRSMLLAAHARIDLEGAMRLGLPARVDDAEVDGGDLLVTAFRELAGRLTEHGAPARLEGDRIRIDRPLHRLLCEMLVPHGWRVPDERGARLAVRLERSALHLTAEASS